MSEDPEALVAAPGSGRPGGVRPDRPSAFLPTDVLFAGSGFAGPYDALLDQVRSGMLDGRTVHFHVQLVEPELLERHPLALKGGKEGKPVAFSASQLAEAAISSIGGHASATVRGRNGFGHRVYAQGGHLTSVVGLVSAAVARLDEAGLGWLPELSVGAIMDVRCFTPDVPCVAMVDAGASAELAAVGILDAAARWLAQLWLQAEAACGGQPPDRLATATRLAGEVFPRLMIAEYRHRAGLPGSIDVAPDAREQILADFPLTRHLVNFWDRRWNRQAFLTGSPFDYASDLRGLYEGWRV